MLRLKVVIDAVVVLSMVLVGFCLVFQSPPEQNFGSGPTRLTQLRDLRVASCYWELDSEGRLVMQEASELPDAPRQSWATQLLPFLDQTALYARIDHSQSWSAPDNLEWFQCEVGSYLNPALWSLSETSDARGYALSHYAANQHIARSNRIADLDALMRADGASNTLMYGEAAGEFSPWGQPGNWRDPAAGLNTSANGFGGPENKVGFVFCDGHLKLLSEDVDPSVLHALSTPDGGETIDIKDW